MKKLKFEKGSIKNFFQKRGFYIALAVCMIMIGIATFNAVNKLGIPSSDDDLTNTSSIKDVGTALSNIPDVNSSDTSNNPSNPVQSSGITSSTKSSNTPSKTSTTATFFVMPVGGTIAKEYNAETLQYSETYKDWRLHLAIDIKADASTAVYSAGDGVVKEIYYDDMLGEVVVIDHGNSILAYYCGLNKQPSVKVGQTIASGKQIGVVDAIPSESVEPTHLHFAMKKDGKLGNPLEIMGMMD